MESRPTDRDPPQPPVLDYSGPTPSDPTDAASNVLAGTIAMSALALSFGFTLDGLSAIAALDRSHLQDRYNTAWLFIIGTILVLAGAIGIIWAIRKSPPTR